ncbi:MAG: GNAT family N-acetyltransferase [Lachnospiraceae bacterium]|nr:GNAT family N-acetyltransferase [Lachnospiraceae bacterium]
MKRIKNASSVMDEIMSENDKILFNLFYLIAEKDSFWVTDGKSYLIGQTNENLPMWIWIHDAATADAYVEIEDIITARLELNPKLKITADAEKIQKILPKISEKKKAKYKSQVPMIIYRCDKVINPKHANGHTIFSNENHKKVLEKFITGMVWDLEKRPMMEGEAENFARDVVGSDNLYLWEANETVVSMAMIAHRTEKFVRINTVYTDSSQRGKGYAGRLVGEVTKKILDENRIPMLYTEQDNVCSNATYRRIGYYACGELTQFCFGL